MRTYPKHTLAHNLIGDKISSSYAFANPLKINVTVNGKAMAPVSATYATNGFSDVTFTSSVIKSIDSNAFNDCTTLKCINVPASAMGQYKRLLPKCLHKKLVGF